jgi:DNA-binding Lrp family transcriptional regulator
MARPTEVIDELDHKLLSLLRSDARRPVAKLASALGISRATVRARIDRLVAKGVIGGFTIMVPDRAGRDVIRAVMMIAVEGKGIGRVMQRLHGFPEVRKLHSTNGHWDIVAELATETLGEFDDLLNRIRALDGITSTETSILLSSPKNIP